MQGEGAVFLGIQEGTHKWTIVGSQCVTLQHGKSAVHPGKVLQALVGCVLRGVEVVCWSRGACSLESGFDEAPVNGACEMGEEPAQ